MTEHAQRLPADFESQLMGAACLACDHLLDLVEGTCLAFPEGIPPEIRQERVRHDHAFPGDGGFQFRSTLPNAPEAM